MAGQDDVLKGVQMFRNKGVMTLALVENMPFLVCKGGGRHDLFEKTQLLNNNAEVLLSLQFVPNPSHGFHLPISTTINALTDSGVPLSCDQPNMAEDEPTAFL